MSSLEWAIDTLTKGGAEYPNSYWLVDDARDGYQYGWSIINYGKVFRLVEDERLAADLDHYVSSWKTLRLAKAAYLLGVAAGQIT